MKYYKSKRGYFYKIVGNKKIRISIEEYNAKTKKKIMKGGIIKNDGELEAIDFHKSFEYKTLTDILPASRSKITIEYLKRINLKVEMDPWFLGNGPWIIFGSDNPQSDSFLFACHNIGINLFKKVIFFENPGISKKEKKIDIDNIDIKYLIELFWGLVNIRENKKPNFMNTLYDTLRIYFTKNIDELRKVLSEELIRQMVIKYRSSSRNESGKIIEISDLEIKKSKNYFTAIFRNTILFSNINIVLFFK
jgi:hypothetical protein